MTTNTRQNIVDIARLYAIECAEGTNHRYDPNGKNLPYEHHLQMVVDVAKEYIQMIPQEDRDNVIAACWLHDSIEDHRQTYNDVKKETNETVAELVYALTNEKGKNREERANAKYYEGIQNTKYAPFIKLCDRIANFKYSVENYKHYDQKNNMAKKYSNEMEHFIMNVCGKAYIADDLLTQLAEKLFFMRANFEATLILR